MHYYTDVFKKYAVFSGRASRKEYWMFTLFNTIVMILLVILGANIASIEVNVLYNLYLLVIIIPSLALGFRRLHDINRSGLLIIVVFIAASLGMFIPSISQVLGTPYYFLFQSIIGLITLIGGIALFIYSIFDSTPGDNKYGPNPKGIPAV